MIYQVIYKTPESIGTGYYYSEVYVGEHDNVVAGFISEYIGYQFSNHLLRRSVGWVHTHPKCNCHIGDDFSSTDKWLTNLPGIKQCYLATSDGTVLKYASDEGVTKLEIGGEIRLRPSNAHRPMKALA